MHAELFALQCFMEWVLKKITEFRKITYDTSHTQTVFSSVQQNAIYMCVFSLFFFLHTPVKPYFWPDYRNWCQLKLLLLATCYNQYSRGKRKKRKKKKYIYISSTNILLLLFSFSFTYRLPFQYEGVTVLKSMPLCDLTINKCN